jgi:hypothetical protein
MQILLEHIKLLLLLLGQQLSLLHIVQTGSGAHPAFYPMGTTGSFPWVKRQGREAEHSPPANAEVKKTWIYTSTPPTQNEFQEK